jgi:hypothetical protein
LAASAKIAHKKNQMARTLILRTFIFFVLASCTSSHELKVNESTEIQNQLLSKSFSFEKKGDSYKLNVVGSKLKTEVGKEFASSISAIILYEQIVKENTSINPDTELNIVFNTDEVYNYTFPEISDAINAKEGVEKTISEFIDHKKNSNAYTCKKIDVLQDINWEAEEIGIAGFKILSKNICNQKAEIVEYHIFLRPGNRHLLFCIDRKTNKLLEISEFRG